MIQPDEQLTKNECVFTCVLLRVCVCVCQWHHRPGSPSSYMKTRSSRRAILLSCPGSFLASTDVTVCHQLGADKRRIKGFGCFKMARGVATCLGGKRIMGKEGAVFKNGPSCPRLESPPSCLMMSLPQQHPLSLRQDDVSSPSLRVLLSKCSFLLLLLLLL